MSYPRRINLEAEQTNPPARHPTKGMCYALTKGKVVVRDPKAITTIGLHQTATPYGVSPQDLKKAGGDRELALHRRALATACHAMAFPTGKFVTHIPLLWFAYHGHGMNPYSYGLEIVGRYAGNLADLKGSTWGGAPEKLLDETIAAAREACTYFYEEGRRLGSPLEYYSAHRQFTAKTSDPGEEIWVSVGIDHCEKVLGLKPRLDYCERDRNGKQGQPIPKNWDPRSTHKY